MMNSVGVISPEDSKDGLRRTPSPFERAKLIFYYYLNIKLMVEGMKGRRVERLKGFNFHKYSNTWQLIPRTQKRSVNKKQNLSF